MAEKNSTKESKRKKTPTYVGMISQQVMDAIQERMEQVLLFEKRYRDRNYNAKKLADELGTNSRYISATVKVRFGMNYASYVNMHRVKDAMAILADKRYSGLTIEDVSDMVGFANRQSFYTAFYKTNHCTPRAYKEKMLGMEDLQDEDEI